jgi:hypothetical protein
VCSSSTGSSANSSRRSSWGSTGGHSVEAAAACGRSAAGLLPYQLPAGCCLQLVRAGSVEGVVFGCRQGACARQLDSYYYAGWLWRSTLLCAPIAYIYLLHGPMISWVTVGGGLLFIDA